MFLKGGYMEAKKTKLQEQFKIEAAKQSGADGETQIFKGIAIFVNGYTGNSMVHVVFIVCAKQRSILRNYLPLIVIKDRSNYRLIKILK